MTRPNRTLALLSMVLTAGTLLPAARGAALLEEAQYKVDTTHSVVLFRIKHLNVSYFHGRFKAVFGEITFDPDNLDACALDVSVRTTSLSTNDGKRDRHIKGPEFFNARKNPKITFKSTSFKKGEEKDTYEVAGEMTLHGQTRPLTIQLVHTGSGPDPWGGHRIGFETVFEIKRSEYGLDAMRGALGDEVRLTVALEAVRRDKSE